MIDRWENVNLDVQTHFSGINTYEMRYWKDEFNKWFYSARNLLTFGHLPISECLEIWLFYMDSGPTWMLGVRWPMLPLICNTRISVRTQRCFNVYRTFITLRRHCINVNYVMVLIQGSLYKIMAVSSMQRCPLYRSVRFIHI